MKKAVRRGYFRGFLGVLKDSVLSLRTNIFVMALHDLLFYTCTFYLIVFWNYLARLQSATVALNPGTFDPTNPTMVNGAVESMKGFIIFLVISLLIFLLISIIVYTFFKGMIWLTITKKKPGFTYFRKFATVNVIWLSIAILTLIGQAVALRAEFAIYLLIAFVALALHLGINITIQYAITEEIKKAFGEGLKTGITKLHHFILPYLVIGCGYVIVLQIGRIFEPLSKTFNFVVFSILTLMYLAWIRIYIFKLIHSIR